ncbi:MAG: hypothetical protein H7175_05935 [Burkholderiales bacterium]|nr:hypothetical protein [Anaerolineae bacterium]
METILLDSDWVLVQGDERIPLPMEILGGAADRKLTFERVFSLEATDFCVRYRLHIDQLPEGASVYIGDLCIDEGAVGSLDTDVTDCLTLDDNRLIIHLLHGGAVSGIRLLQIACDENP